MAMTCSGIVPVSNRQKLKDRTKLLKGKLPQVSGIF